MFSASSVQRYAAIMYKPSAGVKSGLATVKRDWSNASMSAASSSSELIDWEPTPPKQPDPASVPKERMVSASKRLQAIRDALATMNADPPACASVPPAATKRPSVDPVDSAPAKKPRQLPSSWQNDTLSNPSFSRASSENATRQRTTNQGSMKESRDSNRGDGAPKEVVVTVSTSSTSSKANKVPKLFLSQEQTHILNLVQNGNSVFYTGSAGTGKSVLLREIIRTLRVKHSKSLDAVAVTASTGIAACNIGGVTVHSFAGIGLGVDSAEVLADKVKKNRKALGRWLRTKVLIIDEISMVDGDLFDKLAKIGCTLRRNTEPFGGIQIIVTGDFFQLPPVTKGNTQVKFAFEAELWDATIKRTFNLTKVFRQSDQKFVNMLNEMRFGRLSPASVAEFKKLRRDIVYDDGLGPTELFPRREDVESSNSQRMSRLRTEEIRYVATDGGAIQDEDQRAKMLANFMAAKDLRLRIDAQVMLIKNVDEQLVNGTMGRVIRFIDPVSYATENDCDTSAGGAATGTLPSKKSANSTARYPEVEFSLVNGGKRTVLVVPETWKVELPNGEVQVSRTQFPLILAWAMSIHKSQGQTLDRVKVDLNRVFEKGQAYVALSRATSLDGLQVLNFDPGKVKAHEKAIEWTKTLETISDDQ